VACPEEIAFRSGYITHSDLAALSAKLRNSGYGDYLRSILDEKVF